MSAATTPRRRSEGSCVAALSSCLRFLKKKKKKGRRERKQRGRSVLLATATNSPTSPLILFFIRCTRIQSPERYGNPRTLLSPPKSSHLPLNMIARRVTGSRFQIKARHSGVTLFDSLFILVAVGFLPAAGTFRGKLIRQSAATTGPASSALPRCNRLGTASLAATALK